MSRELEIQHKLALLRVELERRGANTLRLKGNDWLFWATGGADHTVLLASETGVAEIVITHQDAWILTDEIEAARLKGEQFSPGYEMQIRTWTDLNHNDAFVARVSNGDKVLCDRPGPGETFLSAELHAERRRLTATEIGRYREVGSSAARAMTEVLSLAKATWSELELAGAAAECLFARGLQPALILAAGANRLSLYRHPLPTKQRLGERAMLVFCARGFGLYANLTRFVSFRELSSEDGRRHQHLMYLEAVALNASTPGKPLKDIYHALSLAYSQLEQPRAIRAHHQGGLTGYLAREAIAYPGSEWVLERTNALAWNPSLEGGKIEDTFLLADNGKLENLTYDIRWPHVDFAGRPRPQILLA